VRDAPAPRQETITAGYDRVAPYYRALSPFWLITPHARRKGVRALGLRAGDRVLEVGVGTGRNLPYLLDAVGPGGSVVGVDLSAGMLAEARKLVAARGWENVTLIEANAATAPLEGEFDAVLFALAYSAIPIESRVRAATRAWEHLRPGGTLAIMDLGLTRNRYLRPLLAPVAKLLDKVGPGDAYGTPWDDLAGLGEVAVEPFMLDLFYVCRLLRPA
jgi:ubiquinone/menaquinone biosynthesis C-methylase UbiE